MAVSSPSKIPTPVLSPALRRSSSMRVRGERPFILYSASPFPSIAEDEGPTFGRSRSQASGLNLRRRDEDLDSLDSFASNISRLSTVSNCEHSPFAKNGTTFSGRSHKYVVHCSNYPVTPEQYLTPTQRATRKINKLKSLLELAKEKLLEKETEIEKLTKEVIELRVFKATLNGDLSEASSPENNVDLSPIKSSYFGGEKPETPIKISPREKMTATPDYLISSLADSGNFDDLGSITSKESFLFSGTPEPKRREDEVVKIYETLMQDRKLEYETELKTLKLNHEKETLEIVDAFDGKLKEEELKFEEKYRDLVKAFDEEKAKIIEEFACRLEKEKSFARENSEEYLKKLGEARNGYEKSVLEIKEEFMREKKEMETIFDEIMSVERKKFETEMEEVQRKSEEKMLELHKKMAELEFRYEALKNTEKVSQSKMEALLAENAKLEAYIKEQEARQKELYLKMYLKGQEAALLQKDEQAESNEIPPVPVPELLVKLTVTETELETLKDKEYRAAHSATTKGVSLISAKEALALWMLAARKAMYKRLYDTQQEVQRQKLLSAGRNPNDVNDPEVTLQFLKSAVYYFLTDRDNHLEHLRAIENILGFSQAEKAQISAHYC